MALNWYRRLVERQEKLEEEKKAKARERLLTKRNRFSGGLASVSVPVTISVLAKINAIKQRFTDEIAALASLGLSDIELEDAVTERRHAMHRRVQEVLNEQ